MRDEGFMLSCVIVATQTAILENFDSMNRQKRGNQTQSNSLYIPEKTTNRDEMVVAWTMVMIRDDVIVVDYTPVPALE